jgi:dephospho-CoA kinase
LSDKYGFVNPQFPRGESRHGERLPLRPVADRYLNWLLSGGIGSGKTVVRQMLEGHGLICIDADGVGHEVLSPGGAAVGDVAARWPDCVVDGSIDRRLLGQVVFSDAGELEVLESLTHPHIFQEIAHRVESANAPVVVEIPQLMQPFSNVWPRIVVDAPDDVRRRRTVERGLPEGDVDRRISAQPSRSEYLAAADIVVPNNGDLEELRSAVELLVDEIGRRRLDPSHD